LVRIGEVINAIFRCCVFQSAQKMACLILQDRMSNGLVEVQRNNRYSSSWRQSSTLFTKLWWTAAAGSVRTRSPARQDSGVRRHRGATANNLDAAVTYRPARDSPRHRFLIAASGKHGLARCGRATLGTIPLVGRGATAACPWPRSTDGHRAFARHCPGLGTAWA
jgi:hypothetical protein